MILLTLAGIPGLAQITFFADTTSGCDSLDVTFSYRNLDFTDTVSSVEWEFGNGMTGSGKQDQTVVYDSPGAYTVSMEINGNSSIERVHYIQVHAGPNAQFSFSDSLELGSYTVVFTAADQPEDSVTYAYQWLFEDGGTGETPSQIHRFPVSGDYRVDLRVTHPAGCMAQSSGLVSVEDTLDCPNVFTPNNDGINDYFIVSSNGVTAYILQIFSRSGVLVYKAEAPILIWDGRNQSGQELLPGTYYYIIREASKSGRLEKKGFVNLYR